MNKMIIAIEIRVAAKRRIKKLLIHSLLTRKMNLDNYSLVILIRLAFSANVCINSKPITGFSTRE